MNKLKNVVEKFFLLSFFLFFAVELIGEDNFANTENANIDIIYSQDYLKEGDELILGFVNVFGLLFKAYARNVSRTSS